MTVPPRFAKPLATAIAAHDAYQARLAREPAPGLANVAFRALSALLAELGLDRASHPKPVEAAELTPEQRATLVALTDGRWISLAGAAQLPQPWPMRRLLGVAPPGILEEIGLGWTGRDAPHDRALVAALAKVPASRRVEAHVEALLYGYAVPPAAFLATLRAHAAAALDYARATLPQLPGPLGLVGVALFSAFSASGTTVPEGADERFPLVQRLPGASSPVSPLLVEHFGAIAPNRRDHVLTLAMQQRASGVHEAAVHLLERCGPLPHAQAAMRRHLGAMLKGRLMPYEKQALVALDKRLKAIESGASAAHAAKPVGARVLAVTARLSPRSEAELTPSRAQQLVETGRRFDGKKLPAARRLSLDENDEAALGAILEHVTVSENGAPAFEAWLHGGASGVFFVAGTTTVAAERTEGGTVLEGDRDDDALLAALSKVGASKRATRSVADVKKATRATPAAKKKAPTQKTTRAKSAAKNEAALTKKTAATPKKRR